MSKSAAKRLTVTLGMSITPLHHQIWSMLKEYEKAQPPWGDASLEYGFIDKVIQAIEKELK